MSGVPLENGETTWINLVSLGCMMGYFPPYGCQFSCTRIVESARDLFPMFLDANACLGKPSKRLFSYETKAIGKKAVFI